VTLLARRHVLSSLAAGSAAALVASPALAGDPAQLIQKVSTEVIELIKKTKGFVRYYWLDNGQGEGASISIFKTKTGAEKSIKMAAAFIAEHLSKLMTHKAEIIGGPIKAHD